MNAGSRPKDDDLDRVAVVLELRRSPTGVPRSYATQVSSSARGRAAHPAAPAPAEAGRSSTSRLPTPRTARARAPGTAAPPAGSRGSGSRIGAAAASCPGPSSEGTTSLPGRIPPRSRYRCERHRPTTRALCPSYGRRFPAHARSSRCSALPAIRVRGRPPTAGRPSIRRSGRQRPLTPGRVAVHDARTRSRSPAPTPGSGLARCSGASTAAPSADAVDGDDRHDRDLRRLHLRTRARSTSTATSRSGASEYAPDRPQPPGRQHRRRHGSAGDNAPHDVIVVIAADTDVRPRPRRVAARRRPRPVRRERHERPDRGRRRTRCSAPAPSTSPATPPPGATTRSASTPSRRPTHRRPGGWQTAPLAGQPSPAPTRTPASSRSSTRSTAARRPPAPRPPP